MKALVAALVVVGWAAAPVSTHAWRAEAGGPRVFLLDGARLERVRDRARAGEADFAAAVAELTRAGDAALTAGPYSVINKDANPPSGDKRDYMSLAPYWWPNPDTADGLPYVRHDGRRNPEIHRVRNRLDLGEMVDAVETLSLAYYFTGEEKYASRATLLIKTWFVDPTTGMNPHMQYGQAVRGVNDGRGIGLIETRSLARVVDAIGLLAGSQAWTAADQHALEGWFAKFLTWMRESKHGREEADASNNHGTFYDVQVASFAMFVGQADAARKVLASVGSRRIGVQVEPDGRQPLELERTKAWSYSMGNLAGLMALARLGEHVEVDLWTFETADGRSIRRALDFLVPFAEGEKEWPYPQIDGQPIALSPALLRLAAAKYPDGPYAAMAAKSPGGGVDAGILWLSPLEPTKDLHRR